MSHLLTSKIARARGKHGLVAVLTGLAAVVAFALAIVFAGSLADWWLDLSRTVRAILLAAYGLGVAALAIRHAVWPIVRAPDDEDIALAVERMEPAFSSRLISAVQFGQMGQLPKDIAASFVRTMIAQTEQMAQAVDFTRAIKTDRLAKHAAAAFGLLLVVALWFVLGGQPAIILLQRMLLGSVDLPTKTHVEMVSGSYLVARGDPAPLKAKATGWRPALGQAEITYESGRRQTVTLEPTKDDAALYAAAIDSVQESFTYRIKIYDGRTDTYTVTVTPRPGVVALACTQIYPAYTGLPPAVRDPADLMLLAGSKLQLKITANKPLRMTGALAGPAEKTNQALVYASGEDKEPIGVALQIDPANHKHATVELPLTANTVGFTIQLLDEQDLASKDGAFYRVEVVPDLPPMVRVTNPDRKEVLVTSQSTVNVGFVAEDDYGLASLVLKYKVDDGAEQSIPLTLPSAKLKSFKGFYPWAISRIAPPSGKAGLEESVIEFYLEAADTNTMPGPGRTITEHYTLRVVSPAEKRAELLARLGESLGAVKEVSEDQEKASSDLGEMVVEQGGKR